ncbi:alpha-1,2-fucosyltransferase [Acidimicrobiia bacterium]|nr:alpha-1,2-fucosyltransferase [Acidimicrobiia bacterium]
MKKIAVVDIKGGFGNQVFQVAFSFFLESNGYKVFLNYEYFDLNNSRSLILRGDDFRLQKVDKIKISSFKLFNRLSLSNKVPKLIKELLSRFFLKIKSTEEFKHINQLPNFLFCKGYFQDLSYLDSFRTEFEQYLQKKFKIMKVSKNFITSSNTLLHIRRTDYVDMGEELNLDFYTKAISYCSEKVPNFEFDIFTDDLNWVKDNDVFKNAANIFEKKEDHYTDEATETLNTFLAMLNYDNYIIGNSTYSLMAYEFSHSSNKKVIVAKPWFRNRFFGNIYPSDSIFIENL